MINSRVVVNCRVFVLTVLTLLLPLADACAKDIRWLREEQGGAAREQQRGQARQRLQQGPDAERRQERRMSPEERYQLRRDIRDAGREIYRPRR